MGEAVISTALQLGFVLVLALIAYAALRRPEGSFLRFTGLYRAPWQALAMGAGFGLAAALIILNLPGMAEMAGGERTVAGDAPAGGLGGEALAALVLAALVKTSLSEELLFRGLIGRTLIRRIGFTAGNAIQAFLFGAVHLLLLLVPSASTAAVTMLVAATGVSGWLSGWLNERRARGSILPGWAAHATANLIAYLAIAWPG
jgi:membrane protease YdiL (CAAX protease family)